MAKLMLIGKVAEIEIEGDYRDDELRYAVCKKHRDEYIEAMGGQVVCNWEEGYGTLDDATEYAADHADRGVR